ncbi:MAG: class I SAM-dependent methyltransferase [Azonexaceae bacterium]|nr:class I SAM-dependent methyltransferase [Azonexaceae bacterium]
MLQDAYRYNAHLYDLLYEPAARIVRNIGQHIYPPRENIAILDVGCGTGTQLALYQKPGCRLVGLDNSPAMLAQAAHKLGGAAELQVGEATQMPFAADSFDLVTVIFVLHEMPSEDRPAVLQESRRVIKPDGQIMLIDYHPGPYPWLMGQVWHLLIRLMEISAGPAHYGNYRHFMATGGLDTLVAGQPLRIDQRYVSEHGVTAIHLLGRE